MLFVELYSTNKQAQAFERKSGLCLFSSWLPIIVCYREANCQLPSARLTIINNPFTFLRFPLTANALFLLYLCINEFVSNTPLSKLMTLATYFSNTSLVKDQL
ncbi:MAG: hypothetical protein ACI9XB_003140 [Gammaproteobacteria bacterium]|jgi:hypothetical protein